MFNEIAPEFRKIQEIIQKAKQQAVEEERERIITEIMRRISVADSLDYSDEKDVLNNLLDFLNH